MRRGSSLVSGLAARLRARNESTKSLQAEVMLTGHGDGGVFERPWTKAYRRCFSTVQPAEIGVTSVTVLERELPENAGNQYFPFQHRPILQIQLDGRFPDGLEFHPKMLCFRAEELSESITARGIFSIGKAF